MGASRQIRDDSPAPRYLSRSVLFCVVTAHVPPNGRHVGRQRGCVNCVPTDYSGADPGWAQSCGVEAAGLAGGCPGFPLVTRQACLLQGRLPGSGQGARAAPRALVQRGENPDRGLRAAALSAARPPSASGRWDPATRTSAAPGRPSATPPRQHPVRGTAKRREWHRCRRWSA
jgi:hypothetical protein